VLHSFPSLASKFRSPEHRFVEGRPEPRPSVESQLREFREWAGIVHPDAWLTAGPLIERLLGERSRT